MPTSDIYKKQPDVNGNIHAIRLPASSAVLNESANNAPIMPPKAVINCDIAACL